MTSTAQLITECRGLSEVLVSPPFVFDLVPSQNLGQFRYGQRKVSGGDRAT